MYQIVSIEDEEAVASLCVNKRTIFRQDKTDPVSLPREKKSFLLEFHQPSKSRTTTLGFRYGRAGKSKQ